MLLLAHHHGGSGGGFIYMFCFVGIQGAAAESFTCSRKGREKRDNMCKNKCEKLKQS